MEWLDYLFIALGALAVLLVVLSIVVALRYRMRRRAAKDAAAGAILMSQRLGGGSHGATHQNRIPPTAGSAVTSSAGLFPPRAVPTSGATDGASLVEDALAAEDAETCFFLVKQSWLPGSKPLRKRMHSASRFALLAGRLEAHDPTATTVVLEWNGFELDYDKTPADYDMPPGVDHLHWVQASLRDTATPPRKQLPMDDSSTGLYGGGGAFGAAGARTRDDQDQGHYMPMCPDDEECELVNEESHFTVLRHSCRIDNCPYTTDAEHAMLFAHPTDTARGPQEFLHSTVLEDAMMPLCPDDENCGLVNDEDHQAQFAHTCRLDPCPALGDDEHCRLFLHDAPSAAWAS